MTYTDEVYREQLWTCRDGRQLRIREMDNEHLLNTHRMIKRQGFIGVSEWESCWDAYFRCEPSGDGALDAYYNGMHDLENAKVTAWVDVLEAEIKRRGLQTRHDS